jgi:hypothetical protein
LDLFTYQNGKTTLPSAGLDSVCFDSVSAIYLCFLFEAISLITASCKQQEKQRRTMLGTSNTTDVLSFCKQSIKIVHTMETESNTNMNSEEQLIDPT